MCEFIMEIAGRRVAVQCTFEQTRDHCKEYLAEDGPVDFSVRVVKEDVYAELEKSKLEAQLEGIPFVKFSAYDYEQSALYRKLAEKLLEFDTLLFHGSAISVDGEAYLFTAVSGTGKSTHTSLWRQTFGDRAVMVNDDKPFLKLTEAGVFACGSPWSGEHGLDSNLTVPLRRHDLTHRPSAGQQRIQIAIQKRIDAILASACRYRPQELCQCRLRRLVSALNPQTAAHANQFVNRRIHHRHRLSYRPIQLCLSTPQRHIVTQHSKGMPFTVSQLHHRGSNRLPLPELSHKILPFPLLMSAAPLRPQQTLSAPPA